MHRLLFTSLPLLVFYGCAGADTSARGDRNTDSAPAFAEQFGAPLQESGLQLEPGCSPMDWVCPGVSQRFPTVRAFS